MIWIIIISIMIYIILGIITIFIVNYFLDLDWDDWSIIGGIGILWPFVLLFFIFYFPAYFIKKIIK